MTWIIEPLYCTRAILQPMSVNSLADLQQKIERYLKRANKFPNEAFGWMNPLEKPNNFSKNSHCKRSHFAKDIMKFSIEKGV